MIPQVRHLTHQVMVGNVAIGGSAAVVVQSMTDTETADIDATVTQVIALAQAGSQLVRVTVNNVEAAQAVPYIKEKLSQKGYDIPLVGCFHYNGHTLLQQVPACAEHLDKYRINPGNVGFGDKRDANFDQIIEIALRWHKPVRIGVNWGSLDPYLLEEMMERNAKASQPMSSDAVVQQTIVASALNSAARAEALGLSPNRIILSAKVSKVPMLISIYRTLAQHSSYSLHLGLTEAGIGQKGTVNTTAALSILLSEGIGDTIRASVTPSPGGSRTAEVKLCQEILQALGYASFHPDVTSCPGCGRTNSTFFRELTLVVDEFLQEKLPIWQRHYHGVADLKVAVMGCIVNGPGESKHANIGISLPGTGEGNVAAVFIDGHKACTLRGPGIVEEFQQLISNYVATRYQPIT